MSELAQARRRIKQLERCLDDVRYLVVAEWYDLVASGLAERDDATVRLIDKVARRLNRTSRRKKPTI